MRTKPRILMAVFNSIDYDGRVQRSASALARIADITVLSINSGRCFDARDYAVRVVTLPRGRFGVPKWAHAYFWLRFWWLSLTTRPAIVYAHDFFLGFAGRVAARLANARFIYDAHELIVPEIRSGESAAPSARDQFWYRIEKAGIGSADAVVCANEVRAAIMREHYELAELPAVIRNIPPRPVESGEPVLVHPGIQALLHRTPDAVLCVYQGDVSIDRGLDIVVDAFTILENRFHLIVVGGGPDIGLLQDRVRQRQLGERVTFLGKVARDQLHAILRTAHIGIITYPNSGANNLHCAPNKIFEYAQAGLPMVMTSQPGLRVYLDRHPIGCAYDSTRREGAPRLAAEAIRAVAARRAYFLSHLEAFLSENDWNTESEKLVRVVGGIMGCRASEAAQSPSRH